VDRRRAARRRAERARDSRRPLLSRPLHAASSKYANEECQGVFIIVTDRAALRPVRVGVEIAAALTRSIRAVMQLEAAERLHSAHAIFAHTV
jgi:uncharacterized protein YbbC (DUF1343 family)